MALGTYTELQAAVKAWMARIDSNFSASIPDMIRLAESRIWKNLRCSDMVSAPSTLTVPAGLNYVALPADWLGFVRLKALDGKDLNYDPLRTLDGFDPSGDQYAYGIEGRTFYYGQNGASPSGTALPFTYYKHPGFLVDVTTTWLLTKYPDVYLFGALWAACVFSKNAAKAGEFDQLFRDARDGVDSSDSAAMISGSRLRRRGPGLT